MPAISLPKGGGAIRAIGEKFDVSPATGTASLTIPLAASSGRSGFGPDLRLAYDSGSGNGPFGFGWKLSTQSIARKTDKGLPQYRDDEESDVFVLSGAEDLVPVLRPDGSRHADDDSAPGFTIVRYRPRVEAAFARIERWVDRATGDTHWRSISRDNVTTLYGRTPESRIADGDRAFEWLVCESYDDKGNAIVYEYAREDDAGVDTAASNERNRRRGANRYLKRVRYGNRVSRLIEPDLARADWMFEVVFDYDEGHVERLDLDPSRSELEQHRYVRAWAAPRGSWAARPDAFSTHRPGFEVRTYRRCRRILMLHRFAELGDEPYLVRATELDYDDLDYSRAPTIEDELAHRGSTRFASFIRSVTRYGYVRDDDRGAYVEKALPPLELEYSKAAIQDEAREVDQESLENVPDGVQNARYQLIDLDGEGVSGILTEQAGAWLYKRSLGAGRFGPLRTVTPTPSLASANGQRFVDLEGDGHLDSVVFGGPTPGFYERTEDEAWAPFREFRQLPDVDWDDPDLRLVDLNGDGHADVLITEQEVFTWYPSLAEEGFGPARRVYQPWDEEQGPRLVVGDATESIFLADMCGDGLPDFVRVRNSEVSYWPNLGYGRFGAQVTMDGSPWLDVPEQFELRRVRLADVDGSGTTDLVYLGDDGVRLYFNRSGNSWAPARRLRERPRVDDPAAIAIADLLGNGTAVLVWPSSSSDGRARLRYVDLMGGVKPHLLVKTANNLGAETHIDYAPSTKYYLADKLAGRPWSTTLPFPVQVVERVETVDRVGRSRYASRYAYHHGTFDGFEREFRGFGLVERWDTEQLAALTATGELPPGDNVDAASHVPPVLVKTWFHTGTDVDFSAEYFREPGLTGRQARELLLDDTVLPAGLTPEERREAARALKGSVLRQEVYGLDGSDQEPFPYTVTEQNLTIEVLQRRGRNRHAVFFTHSREKLGYTYEREPADPRITHSLTLEADEWGNELVSAAVGYGRRSEDPSLLPQDRAQQARLLATHTENRVTNAIVERDDFRAPLSCDSRSFELTGLALRPGQARLSIDDLQEAIATADTIPYEAEPTEGRLERRLIGQVRTVYRRDDLAGPLPLGELQPRALVFEGLKLALTAGLVADAYGERVDDEILHDGGYVHSEGDRDWWVPSGRILYSPAGFDSPAEELAYARRHFFLPHRYRDPFHSEAVSTESHIRYDDYDLLALETIDPLGNRITVGERDRDSTRPLVRAGHDYRVLQPRQVMDPNRNRTEVAFDALGTVAGTAAMGKPEEDPAPGDRIGPSFRPDLTQAEIASFLADPTGPEAADVLGDATTRVVDDLSAYWRDPRSRSPGVTGTIARETHASEPQPAGGPRLQVSFSYADGLGREIQRKLQAEPDPADGRPRWAATGWTVFNNKGKAVRQYEPFFTHTHRFEHDVRAGVSPIVFYDPAGRVAGALNPDHTWSKTVASAWHEATWDPGDTVLVTDPTTDPDVGDFFARLPESDYLPTWYALREGGELGADERAAARAARVYSGTPTVAHLDSLGRTFLVETVNRFERSDASPADPPIEERYRVRAVLDIKGRNRATYDARGRLVVRQGHDLLGNVVHSASMDAGERRALGDAKGKGLLSWNGRDQRIRTAYDVLRRPTDAFLRDGRGRELVVARTIYGESLEDPEAGNFRGKAVRVLDQAGEVTTDAFDFKGNQLRTSRRLAEDYRSVLDWSQDVALAASAHTSSVRYDALARPVELAAPDGSVIRPAYNEANLLERVDVNLRGERKDGDRVWTPFVVDVEYDAGGRRMRIEYGNRVATTYDYDPLTFRLTDLVTRRGRRSLQRLHYTHDPVGNVAAVHDDAQQTLFFRNKRVDPSSAYTYDAVYRLIEATGREHLGQVGAGPPPSSYEDVSRARLGPSARDEGVMARYRERYAYDAAGNLLEVLHRGADPAHAGWRRDYSYEEPSPLEPETPSNRLTSTTTGTTTEAYSVDGDGYDAHGNMLRMPHLQAIEWDFADRLRMTRRQAGAGDGECTWYVYDATGQRVRKVTESASGQVKDERTSLGGWEVYRRHGSAPLVRETLQVGEGGQRIALVETRTEGADRGPRRLVRYQLGNHLGSTTLELDDQARLLSYEEYTPFGSTSYLAVSARIVAPKRFRYTGKERDDESGLYYHGARYYAPWLGRWTRPDPAGLVDGASLYVYGRNNPIANTDSTGTECDPTMASCVDPTPPPSREELEQRSIPEEHMSREEIEKRSIPEEHKPKPEPQPPPPPPVEHSGPEIRAVSDEELRRQASDRRFYYDEPPEKTGHEGLDYLGYAMIYGLKQTVYKPIKSWVLDERPQYLDKNGNVQTYTGHIDRSGELTVAFGTIATFVLPTPKVVKADALLATEGSTGMRIIVADGKPVLQLAPELEASLPVMGRGAAADAPLLDLPLAPAGKTVAVGEGTPVLTSGYGAKSAIPGYNGSVAVDAWRFAQESGVPFASHFKDRFVGAPGAYYATHAEAQVLYLNPWTKFINVSKAPCVSCTSRISMAAAQSGQPITVLSPDGFQWFMPDGTIF